MSTRRITLGIDALAFGGEGVGRDADGQVVFVAGAAPGDRLEVEIDSVGHKARFVRGVIVRVIEPGQRVVPPCRYIDRCGGCPWQHVSATAQREAKQAIVTRALAPFLGVRVEPLVAAPETFGYRTRARMVVHQRALGFHGRRSHDVVDVEACLLLNPRLDHALQRLRALGLPDETVVSGLVAPPPDEQVHLSLVLPGALDAKTLAAAAALLDETIVGIELHGAREHRRVGQRALDVDGWQARAGGFAQANWAQNRWLVDHVSAAVAEVAPSRIVELYAGSGNFTGALMAIAPSGVAVEGDVGAARALAERVRSQPNAAGWTTRAESDTRTARWLFGEARAFDVAVLDPPRAGAKELVAALGQIRGRIVYVSCDPMTLARDVGSLVTAGFTTGRAWPVDMMPQTAHIEVLCVLDREA